MNRALYSGLSGTLAHQLRMDVAANNLANVSTVGYKASRISFQETFSQTIRSARPASADLGSVNAVQVGTGVEVGAMSTITTQGTFQYTGQTLDAAINGLGMFVLEGPEGRAYTREGIFGLDGSNRLVMSSTGLRVQGWMATNGTINANNAVTDLTFPLRQTRAPNVTSTVDLQGNFDASAQIGDAFSCSVTVYDSLGNGHDMVIDYEKTALNAWTVTAACEGNTATSNVTFDSSGALTAGGTLNLTGAVPGGAANLDIDLDLTAATQFSADSDLTVTDQDGYGPATLLGVSITDGGIITGGYSDGRSSVLGQVALASFASPDGLERQGDNLFAESAASGMAQLAQPGDAGLGEVQGQYVEMSNTDLTSAFMDMLVTQRAYQASTRVISTADGLLEETIRLMQ